MLLKIKKEEGNMKLRKIIAIVLASTMTLALLAGCGSSSGGSTEKESTEGSTESSTEASGEEATEGAATSSDEIVTLTLLKDPDNSNAGLEKVAELAEEKIGVKIDIEERVAGGEGDNLVKTRLASGDMADICLYNSGAKFAALNPSEYFMDISGEDFVSRLDDTYKETVTVDGVTYGVPFSSTQVGAAIYNKKVYEELNLEVPRSWDEFLANCEAIKASGTTALLGTFGDSWTTQLIFLGDQYAVEVEVPDFPEEFEAGRAKYETTPAAIASLQKYVDTRDFYNDDYLAATYSDGVDMIANGEAAHWFMLSQAIGSIGELYPEELDNIGVFAIPGKSAETTGITAWMPSSLYGNKHSEHQDAIKKFMEFWVSDEALDAYTSAVTPDGPYAIKGYELPDDACDAVRVDIQEYYNNNKVGAALEFKTSVKGANCEGIMQEIITGQISAEEAAKAYDEDCLKQAIQLGLDWE